MPAEGVKDGHVREVDGSDFNRFNVRRRKCSFRRRGSKCLPAEGDTCHGTL